MSKHTPGPWWRDDDGFIAARSGEDYITVADPHCSSMDIYEREANTDLIAAAPELLAALRDCITEPESAGMQNGLGRMKRRLEAVNTIARAAIAKAEGKLNENN